MNLGFDRVGRIKRAQFALSVAAMLALAACGGGGGGSSSSGGSSGGGGTNTASASGIASKGLLANADVTAYAVNADGSADKSRALGTATTDAAGRYTISGLPAGTAVILEVTPKASGTTMYDEATGETVDLTTSSEFSLTAAVVLDSSGTTSAQITPYTTMAVELAKTQKAADSTKPIADVITAANTSISTALNVPILSAEPVFSSDKKPSNEAAVKLAAVSKLAQTDTVCGALSETLARVKCAVKKLKDEAKRERDDEDNTVIGATLVTQLNTAQDAVEKDPTVTISVAAVTKGTVTQAVSKTDQDSAVAAAKALVRNLRSTLSTMADKDDATSLASRGKVVGNAFDASHRPFNQAAVIGTARVLDMVTRGNDDSYKHGSQFQPQSNLDGAVLAVPGALGGGCKVYTDETLTTEKTAEGFPVTYMVGEPYVGCRITFKVTPGALVGMGPSRLATATQMVFMVRRLAQGVAPGSVDRYSVKTLLVEQSGTVAAFGGFQRDNSTATDKVSGKLLDDASLTWPAVVAQRTVKVAAATEQDFATYSDISLVGNLAPSPSQWAWGQLPGKAAVGSTSVDAYLGQGNGQAEGTTRATIKGLFALLGTNGSTVLSSFKLKEGSYVESVTAEQGDVSHPTSASGKVDLQFEATAYGGAVISGELMATDFVDLEGASNQAVPRTAVFSGSVKESASAAVPLFTGSLTVTLRQTESSEAPSAPSAPNGPSAPASPGPSATPSAVSAALTSLDVYDERKIVLDGTLVTSGSNTLQVGLTLTLDVLGEGTLNGTLTVSGANGASIKLDMTVSADVTASSYLKLEDLTSGVKLQVAGTDEGAPGTTSLYKGTTVVGLIDFDQAKVTYVDNTYEQF